VRLLRDNASFGTVSRRLISSGIMSIRAAFCRSNLEAALSGAYFCAVSRAKLVRF